MNKILPLIVVTILVLGCFGAVGTTNDSERQLYMINETTETSFDDEIDQYQNEVNEGVPVGNFEGSGFPRYNWSVAQSFIPDKEVLTRVKLALSRNTMPPTIFPLVVSIRDDLSGKNLAIASIEPEDIFEFPEYSLIEFDFDDILVMIGQTYYIGVYTKNVTDNGYVWGVNLEGGYPHGGVYVSWDDGSTWNDDFVAIDTAFVTYGRNNAPPNTPTINGPTSGKAGTEYEYKLKSIDSDDDITYCIDWGDDTGEICIGPYPSDLEVTASHTWISEGTFTIKVKSMDALGAESDWATLEVSMPKNKAVSLVEVSIIQPWKGTLYLWGMPLPILPSATIIIGNITVLVSAISLQLMDKLEFYVDSELKYTETNPAVSWQLVTWDWDEKIFFKHTLKVVAYDKGGNTASDEIDVRIFNI